MRVALKNSPRFPRNFILLAAPGVGSQSYVVSWEKVSILVHRSLMAVLWKKLRAGLLFVNVIYDGFSLQEHLLN